MPEALPCAYSNSSDIADFLYRANEQHFLIAGRQTTQQDVTRAMAAFALIRSALRCALSAYQRVEVTHRGKYSVERLLALQEYAQSTSSLRVLFVCFLTPIPMLVIALELEIVPLQDPNAGWRANYGMWIRTSLTVVFGTCVIVDQVRLLIPGIGVRTAHTAFMGLISAALYTAGVVVLAVLWAFPIPSMIVIMYAPSTVIIGVAFFAVVARYSLGRLRRLDVDRLMLLWYVRFLVAQALLGLTYPVYSVVFTRLSNVGLVC